MMKFVHPPKETDSLRTLLHSVILRFREEEVPFEQETKPATEKQLQRKMPFPGEFQMKPSTGFEATILRNHADTTSQSSLQCVEVDEEKGESDEKAVLLEVKQRNEDLLLLEKAVSTLNSLHEHLNFLVHTQDATLNRIDVNISQACRVHGEKNDPRVLPTRLASIHIDSDTHHLHQSVGFWSAVTHVLLRPSDRLGDSSFCLRWVQLYEFCFVVIEKMKRSHKR
ncbi:hypothetical protein OSTOST_09667 [Ostertagia ostertagi]